MSNLHRGVVFFTQHREVTSSDAHYLVVINKDPDNAELIVFGVITSNIENAKKRVLKNGESPSTLVTITPAEYPELKHDSVIDCNSPVKYSKWEFEKNFGQLNSKRVTDMPEYICDVIANGIALSKQVPAKTKKALLLC